ncbi:MAG TPA: cytochrome c biogenesis protein CcdA [Gemmatimonas sp.]|nr:cytochrome c biogenesis protein CcdA [Gemmatimonas sp.]
MPLPNVASLLSSQPAAAIPLIFLGGVLTSLTPCIYPMIPITAAVVGQSAADATTGAIVLRPRRVVVLRTMAYVSGLALAYASLGLVAGLSGTIFGGISTNPWLMIAMANLLLAFALMMLDVFPVAIPQRWMNAAARAGQRGGLAGAFAMGGASGLVAAPCGAPVMAALLTWVSTTKSAFLGFTYLFVFSLGMCALLVVIGLAAGGAVHLPRAGAWMLTVKKVFALLMIGTAQYYLLQAGQLLL